MASLAGFRGVCSSCSCGAGSECCRAFLLPLGGRSARGSMPALPAADRCSGRPVELAGLPGTLDRAWYCLRAALGAAGVWLPAAVHCAYVSTPAPLPVLLLRPYVTLASTRAFSLSLTRPHHMLSPVQIERRSSDIFSSCCELSDRDAPNSHAASSSIVV